jgi:hypothetical protein
MTIRPIPALGATLILAAALVGCQDTPAQPAADTTPPDAEHMAHAAHGPLGAGALPAAALDAQSLAALRHATARYHRVAVAEDDGFLAPPPDECVAAPAGGMGFHYVNPAHMDLTIDPARPEALLYEPTGDRRLRLVGAEFLVHGDAWDAANAEPPTFAGQPFDPPTDRSAAAPPGPFYTLHVWIWKDNPSGMFAPFNPRVSCG